MVRFRPGERNPGGVVLYYVEDVRPTKTPVETMNQTTQ